MRNLILASTILGAALALAAPAVQAEPLTGNHVDQRLHPRGARIHERLERRGERIDARFERRAARQASLGHERRATWLAAKGERIERRLDRRGGRIDRWLGGSAD